MMYYLIIALSIFSSILFAMDGATGKRYSPEQVSYFIEAGRAREFQRKIVSYAPKLKNKMLEIAIKNLNSALDGNEDAEALMQKCHHLAAAIQMESNTESDTKKYTLAEVRQIKANNRVPIDQSNTQQDTKDELLQCLEDADNGIIREEKDSGDAAGHAS